MNKIDNILNALQAQKPRVEDEDAFIGSIMDNLPDFPLEKRRPSGFIIALRTISSVAAVFLIGWFIYLNLEVPTLGRDTPSCDAPTRYCSDMSRCSTPQEALALYSQRKSMNINNLINMYNGK